MDTLEKLGWNDSRREEYELNQDKELKPARVASAVSGRYRLLGLGRPVWAAARGKLQDAQNNPAGLPAAGDWVLVRPEGETCVVERILERRSVFKRKAAGRTSQTQILAANLDRVFITTSVGKDFNPRRIERYLMTVWDGGAQPIILLNKTDIHHDRAAIQNELDIVAVGVETIFISAESGEGFDRLLDFCETGKTIAFVGSSGVGKSTIINRLLGQNMQETSEIRANDERGRHTTVRQELIATQTGALLIDTPGIRELGIADEGDGLDMTFADILEYAQACRFGDCRHQGEPGCAVAEAIEEGEISRERVDSYHRLLREMEYNVRRSNYREASNSKKRFKNLSKTIRDYYRIKES